MSVARCRFYFVVASLYYMAMCQMTYVNRLVCSYHAVHSLDFNIQILFLFEQILELSLSGLQGLGFLGLHHLDVVKLKREKHDGNGEINRRRRKGERMSRVSSGCCR